MPDDTTKRDDGQIPPPEKLWHCESIHVTPTNPNWAGVSIYFFCCGSSVSSAADQGDELARALDSTVNGRLTFTPALEDAGNYFWQRALYRVDVNPTYWKTEQN